MTYRFMQAGSAERRRSGRGGSPTNHELEPRREREPTCRAGIGLDALEIDGHAAEAVVVRNRAGERVGAVGEGDRQYEGRHDEELGAVFQIEAAALEPDDEESGGRRAVRVGEIEGDRRAERRILLRRERGDSVRA